MLTIVYEGNSPIFTSKAEIVLTIFGTLYEIALLHM